MPIPTYNAKRGIGSDATGTIEAAPSSDLHGDEAGRPTGAGVNTGAGRTRPKTEAELAADHLYEEAMEDEYAKREGGS